MVVRIWLIQPISKRVSFLERRPIQVLGHLKRNVLSISWNGFTITLAHLGTGVVVYICPQADVLWEPTYQRFVSWTVGLGRLRALTVRGSSGSDGRSCDRPGGFEGSASLPPAE